jgi:hypothetical protein
MVYAAGGILLLLIIFVYAVVDTVFELRRDRQKLAQEDQLWRSINRSGSMR